MSIILDGTAGITLPTGAEVVSTTGTQTLTNKTLSGASNTIDNLNASNLSTGTVPTARLGSGTANSTTFLRGDQTWQTISVTPSTADVLNATAGATAGGVGTYAFLRHTTSADYAFGATLAGSSLSPAGIATSYTSPGNSSSTDRPTAGVSTGTVSGTWRCMGLGSNVQLSTNNETTASVWLRIS